MRLTRSGKKNSEVWIVGLNPGMEPNWKDDERTSKEREELLDKENKPYFKHFKTVSETIYNNFGKEKGTAHTDIVKCSSKKFPPESVKGKEINVVIDNCKGYLKTQIETHKPKIIVCNGAVVSKFMLKFLPPPSGFTQNETSYWTSIDGAKVCVILSGFIGRIDNYAKRRLGIEIEERLRESH